MADRDADDLDCQVTRLEGRLPEWAVRMVQWARKPSSRPFRIPAGIVLTLAGVFGVLPVLGLWMVPLGLFLLAQDFAILRRPLASLLARLGDWLRDLRPGRDALVVTHGVTSRVLRGLLVGGAAFQGVALADAVPQGSIVAVADGVESLVSSDRRTLPEEPAR